MRLGRIHPRKIFSESPKKRLRGALLPFIRSSYIKLSGGDAAVPENVTYGLKIDAVAEKMAGYAVPEPVGQRKTLLINPGRDKNLSDGRAGIFDCPYISPPICEHPASAVLVHF